MGRRRIIEEGTGSSLSRVRHILSTEDLSVEEIRKLTAPGEDGESRALRGLTMAMLFFSPSTRTRLSFARACHELQMQSVIVQGADLRVQDGESIRDTAVATSLYSDVVGIRNHGEAVGYVSLQGHQFVSEFAANSSVPVINLECDMYHPNQALADLGAMRVADAGMPRSSVVVSWAYSPTALRVPAVANELLLLLTRFGLNVTLAHPPEFSLDPELVERGRDYARECGGSLQVETDRARACSGARFVYARNWTTSQIGVHGVDVERELHSMYRGWKYTEEWLSGVAPNAQYMHCLPVHRGYEATDELIDGRRSLIRQQMVWRLRVQKRILRLVCGGGR